VAVVLDKILELLELDDRAIVEGKERQDATWHNREVDYLPIIFAGEVPEKKEYQCYNLKEQFFDKEKMLQEELWPVIAHSGSYSDAQLSLRANLGTGFVATVFGLEQEIFEDKMPWLKKHLSKEEIINFEFPPDITKAGLMPRAIEYIKFFQEKLAGKVHVFLSDTQGPFDIAHLVRGDEIFTDMYDDPDFVHHLLKLSTCAYIACSKAMKQANGEALDSGYHNTLYMGRGGIRVCEDTTTLLSPDLIRDFVIPYLKQVLKAFGGGWVHFCGYNPHLLDLLLEIELVRGINFGNPEKYDYEKVMEKLLKRGKFYHGGWPRKDKEDLKEYFGRILKPLKKAGKGLIFSPALTGEEIKDPQALIGLWRSLQEV
jgi:uroporphyrinogen-III decarboxylase